MDMSTAMVCVVVIVFPLLCAVSGMRSISKVRLLRSWERGANDQATLSNPEMVGE